MGDHSVKPKVLALLLPADRSEVKLVSYDCMDREDGDRNMNAEFYDPIPDLRPWLGNCFHERRMATFYVDTKEQCLRDPVTSAFIKSEDSTSHGRYCLYYTLSSARPLNETCRRLTGVEIPLGALS